MRNSNKQIKDKQIESIVRIAVYGEHTAAEGKGASLNVIGTGWEQESLPVMMGGYGFTLAKGADAEVVVLAGGSDPSQRVAFPCLPWAVQRVWQEGCGGIQAPLDGKRAVEFNNKRLWVQDKAAAIGENGAIELAADGTIILRGNVVIAGNLDINGDLKVSGKISGDKIAGGQVSSVGKQVVINPPEHALPPVGGDSADKPAKAPDWEA